MYAAAMPAVVSSSVLALRAVSAVHGGLSRIVDTLRHCLTCLVAHFTPAIGEFSGGLRNAAIAL